MSTVDNASVKVSKEHQSSEKNREAVPSDVSHAMKDETKQNVTTRLTCDTGNILARE
jgi:hypothetical protein